MGLFGGTFDPVHYGHILPITEAASRLHITSVTLIPCHIPPHKGLPQGTNKDRVKMLELVCRDHPLFKIDNRELLSSTKSYTYSTLVALKQLHPQQHLCFFIGMDSLLSFTRWFKWSEILTLSHLVVCQRPQKSPKDELPVPSQLTSHLTDDLADLTKFEFGKIIIVDTDKVDVSSSEIREHVKSQQCIKKYVPSALSDYIDRQQLYR